MHTINSAATRTQMYLSAIAIDTAVSVSVLAYALVSAMGQHKTLHKRNKQMNTKIHKDNNNKNLNSILRNSQQL